MLKVDVTSLSSGIHELDLDPAPGEVNLDPTTFDDIHVHAVLQCHWDRVLVQLEATAVAELTCDRTLQPYEQSIEGSYTVLFGPPSLVGTEGEEFEEVRPFDRTDREIDLTEVIRDTLLLALPQRRVAPGAEDEAIRREFGASGAEEEEDSVDPRWSKLQQLKGDE